MSATRQFRVVLADPAWLFRDSLPGRGRGASKHYQCLSVEELERFPLPPLADDCALFMWRVAAMPDEALRVVKAWGFTVKSELVWHKLRPSGKPFFGMGHYVRNSHEICHIATRGRPQKRDATSARNIPSVFSAPMPVDARGRLIHSAKPRAIFEIVERMYEGPYVELFARRHVPGWTCIGNELPQAA